MRAGTYDMNMPNTPLPWSWRPGLVPCVVCDRGTVAAVASQRHGPYASIPPDEEDAIGRILTVAPDAVAFLQRLADEVDRPGGTLQNVRWYMLPDFRAILARASTPQSPPRAQEA